MLVLSNGKITRDFYLVSLVQIVSNSQAIGYGAVLIINNSVLTIMLGGNCFFVSPSGTAVLLKYDHQ